MKGVQLGDADGLTLPFGFEQIDFTAKLEAAVDLLAAEAEWFLGGQSKGVEEVLEKALESVTARLWGKPGDLQEIRLGLLNPFAIDGVSRGTWRSWLRSKIARKSINQPLVAGFGIDDRVLAGGAREIFRTMFPKRREGTNGGGIIAILQEIAKSLSLRPSVHGIFWVVDVDFEL